MKLVALYRISGCGVMPLINFKIKLLEFSSCLSTAFCNVYTSFLFTLSISHRIPYNPIGLLSQLKKNHDKKTFSSHPNQTGTYR